MLLAKYAFEVISKMPVVNLPGVININIPRLSKGKPKGVKVVPQSTMGFEEHFVKKQNDTGQVLYQLAGGELSGHKVAFGYACPR